MKETEEMLDVATTMPAGEATPASTTTNAATEEDALAEDEEGYTYPTLSSPLQYLFFGFIVLVVPFGLFVYCGGPRWMKRVLSRESSRSEYQQVRSEDPEK